MRTGLVCGCAALWLVTAAALPAQTSATPAAALASQAASKLLRGDVTGALADADQSIRLDPSQAGAYETRARCRQRRDDLPGALGDLNTAIALQPRDADRYYVTRGHVRFQSGDAEGAVKDYGEAIRRAPRNALAFLGRSAVEEAQGDLDGAYTDAETAIYCDPGLAEAYGHRGILRARNKNIRGAKDDFDQAILLGTRTAGIYFQRGLLRQWTGDYAGARDDYDAASRLAPSIPHLHLNRAVADQALGQWDEAASDYAQELAQAARRGEGAGRIPFCLWLAKRKAHPADEAATAELKRYLAGRPATPPPDWEASLGAFLLGQTDEAALLAAAATADDARVKAWQQCEAGYYAGMRRLLDSAPGAPDPAGAADCFRQAIATEQETRLEYTLAKAMLAAAQPASQP